MMSLTAFKAGTTAGGVVEYAEKGILEDEKKGREDYYLESGTAPATMLGGGWEALGKSDSKYDRNAFTNALEGKNLAGETLVAGRGDGSKRVPGFDLTFSADKSISVAWAAGNEPQRRAIEAAHDRAVKAAVEHVEQRFNLANEGKGGKEQVSAKIAAAAFRHGTSRAQDPDLHTHVVVSNIAVKADGKIVSLNAREIYNRQHEAGAIYRAELARELQQQGFEIARHGRGDQFIRIAGVPKDIEDYYSKRRAEIESKMTSGQTHGGAAKAAEAAALSTREGKKEIEAAELRKTWQQELQERGFNSQSLEDLKLHKDKPHKLSDIQESAILNKLTRNQSTFSKNDIYREMAIEGQGVLSAKEIADRSDKLLQSPDLIKLVHQETGNIRYSTREMRNLEEKLVSDAGELRAGNTHQISETSLQKAIQGFEQRKGWSLTNDQRDALKAMASGGELAIIQGAAGTGKSAAVEVAADAWREAGYRVRGLAPSGKAAAELAGAGIETDTIAGALQKNREFNDGLGRTWPPKDQFTKSDVLVIDEAGMAGSRDTHELISAAKAAGSKIVLIGDTKQLQAVAAGGAFAALQKKHGIDAELTDVRRQKSEGARTAVNDVRRGEIGEALKYFQENKSLHVANTKDEAKSQVLRSWDAKYKHDKPEACVMLANTNAEVYQLNQGARSLLKEKGVIAGLGGEVGIEDRAGASVGNREFLAGDRVVFLRNAKLGEDKTPVKNGQTGTIEKIALARDGKAYEISARQDNGENVKFRTDEYKAIDHGYALTTHKAQGISADHVSILAGGNMQNLNSTYVQISRMRESADFVLQKDELDKALSETAPTKSMVNYANDLAKKRGVDMPDYCRENFIACRDFLNENGFQVDSKKENVSKEFYEIRESIKAMGRENTKETTLDYREEEKIETAEHGQEDKNAVPSQDFKEHRQEKIKEEKKTEEPGKQAGQRHDELER